METDLPYKTVGNLRPAGDPSPAIDDFKNYVGDIWFCFRHNFFKNYLQDQKIVLKSGSKLIFLMKL